MSKQFKVIESIEVFKDAVENHFIPLLQDTLQQQVKFRWSHDKVCSMQYVDFEEGIPIPQRVIKTIFWDEENKCAKYMDSEMPKGRPVTLN